MVRVLSAVLVAALAGCSTVSAPTSYYRAVGDTEQITIGGSIEQRPSLLTLSGYAHRVSITLNGDQVISGDMGGENAADYSAEWRGRRVTASCMALSTTNIWTLAPGLRCLVFINGERAGTVAL